MRGRRLILAIMVVLLLTSACIEETTTSETVGPAVTQPPVETTIAPETTAPPTTSAPVITTIPPATILPTEAPKSVQPVSDYAIKKLGAYHGFDLSALEKDSILDSNDKAFIDYISQIPIRDWTEVKLTILEITEDGTISDEELAYASLSAENPENIKLTNELLSRNLASDVLKEYESDPELVKKVLKSIQPRKESYISENGIDYLKTALELDLLETAFNDEFFTYFDSNRLVRYNELSKTSSEFNKLSPSSKNYILSLDWLESQNDPELTNLISEVYNKNPEVIETINGKDTYYLANFPYSDGVFLEDGIIDEIEKDAIIKVANEIQNPAEFIENGIISESNKAYGKDGKSGSNEFTQKLETPSIIYYFNEDETETIKKTFLRTELQTQKEFSFFGVDPTIKFRVYIFDTKENKDRIALGEVYYPAIYIWNNIDFEQIIDHEITHLVEMYYLGGRYWNYAWLADGIAEYMAFGDIENSYKLEWLDKYRDEIRPFETLDSNREWENLRPVQTTVPIYVQAHSAIEFIIKKFGREKLMELFVADKNNISPERAIQKTLGMTYSEFNQQWREWLREEYGI